MKEQISQIIESQRSFFKSGATLDLNFRLEMLKKLDTALVKWEKPLTDALWSNLHKSYQEAYLTELSIVKAEVKNHIKHLKAWAKPKRIIPYTSYPISI